MYYNARWYDPALGRFAQADSIIPPGVQGLDRYAYVNNSPMNYVDPTGHEPKYGCYSSDVDGNCTNANETPITYGNGIGGKPRGREIGDDFQEESNENSSLSGMNFPEFLGPNLCNSLTQDDLLCNPNAWSGFFSIYR